MKVLMVGRSKSIAFEDLKKYWGEVDFVRPPKMIRPKKYDLVIGQEPTPRVGIYSYLVSRLVNAKLFFEMHADYLRTGLTFFQRRVAEYLLRRCHLVRAVSKGIERELREIGIENVVMIPSIYIRTDVYRPLIPHSSRKPLVLSVGRFVEQKNFPLLLYAFKEVIREIPQAELIIHGRGPLEKEIIRLAWHIGLLGNLKFVTRWLTEEELVSLYNEASVLAITSRYEGGPRVAFEAGACCTPFISTRVGILYETVPDGVGGLYVDDDPREIADKIISLLNDAYARQRMGENMRKIVLENFEWNTAVKRYAEAYLNLIHSQT